MGLEQFESSARYHASENTELDEFDLERGPRAEPLYIASADGDLLSFAPEEELTVFCVIEQYEPAEPKETERFDSARPFSPWWMATVAGAVLLGGVSTGLLIGAQVQPEQGTTQVQVQPESTAEALSSLAPRVMASAPARSLDSDRAARPQPASGPVSRLVTDDARELGPDELRRAFASLDTQGIPFEQCSVRVPAVDRVVIRCHARRGDGDLEGDRPAGPPAEWTVDFNRALDRWQVVSAPAL